MVQGRRGFSVQELMRALLIVNSPEPVESALLGRQVGSRGTGGFGFEGFVHAFMCAVLLGLSGQDALVLNA